MIITRTHQREARRRPPAPAAVAVAVAVAVPVPEAVPEAKYQVPSTKCPFESAHFKVPSTKCPLEVPSAIASVQYNCKHTVPLQVQSAQSAHFKVPIPKCPFQSAQYKMPSTKCQFQSANSKVPSTKCPVQNAQYKGPISKYQVLLQASSTIASTQYKAFSTIASAKCPVGQNDSREITIEITTITYKQRPVSNIPREMAVRHVESIQRPQIVQQ
jgi:hypothetical protein